MSVLRVVIRMLLIIDASPFWGHRGTVP